MPGMSNGFFEATPGPAGTISYSEQTAFAFSKQMYLILPDKKCIFAVRFKKYGKTYGFCLQSHER